jgi:hypothetical protein
MLLAGHHETCCAQREEMIEGYREEGYDWRSHRCTECRISSLGKLLATMYIIEHADRRNL